MRWQLNHWWHVPFYVSLHGLTTGPIPYRGITFEMEFDFRDHVLRIETGEWASRNISLKGFPVAEFYERVFSSLKELGITEDIRAAPYEIPDVSTEPFATDETHAAYDEEYVERLWQILVQIASIFQVFRRQFIGKSSPVHFFWHHVDLSLPRFSGRGKKGNLGDRGVQAPFI